MNVDYEKWRIMYLEQQKKDRLVLKLNNKRAMQKDRLDQELDVYKHKVKLEELRTEVELKKLESSQAQVTEITTTTKKATTKLEKNREEVKAVEAFSEEDIEFNSETLYDEGKDVHMGKIAKTPSFHASKVFSETLDRALHQEEVGRKFRQDLDAEDKKKGRTRALIQSLLWAHSVSARSERWPEAPDKDMIPRIKDEIITKLNRYEGKAIHIIMGFLQSIWKDKVGQNVEMNISIVSDYVNKMCEDYKAKTIYLDEVRMENSPFVKIMVEKIKEIDPEFNEAPLIQYLKNIKLRDILMKKKADAVTFFLAYNYYRYRIHPYYKDTHDDVLYRKEEHKIAAELRDKLSAALDKYEEEVQKEYIQFENLRRNRGVIDKVW